MVVLKKKNKNILSKKIKEGWFIYNTYGIIEFTIINSVIGNNVSLAFWKRNENKCKQTAANLNLKNSRKKRG